MSPILAMSAQKALGGSDDKDDSDDDAKAEKEKTAKDGWTEHQEPLLLQLLASELEVEVADIVDFELSLFDIQEASLGGVPAETRHALMRGPRTLMNTDCTDADHFVSTTSPGVR